MENTQAMKFSRLQKPDYESFGTNHHYEEDDDNNDHVSRRRQMTTTPGPLFCSPKSDPKLWFVSSLVVISILTIVITVSLSGPCPHCDTSATTTTTTTDGDNVKTPAN